MGQQTTNENCIIMEYSELKNIIFKPFADFITDIKKQQQADIYPGREENGQFIRIYPKGSLDHELDRLRKNLKPILDARLLIKNFIHNLDPELRRDIESNMKHQIRLLIVSLHKIRGEQEMNYIFPFIDDMLEYLRTLKNTIGPATEQQKAKKLYDSLDRARGYCLGIAFEEGKISEKLFEDKAALKAFAAEKFDLNKKLKDPGQKIYVKFKEYFKRNGGPKSQFIRELNKPDLIYANVLYNEIFKD